MWRTLVIMLAVLILGISAASAASVNLDKYRNAKGEELKGIYKIYLDGVREGLVVHSAMQNQETRIFCMPGNLALTIDQAEDIMLRFANDRKMPGDSPISILLLGGLQATFPCR